MTSILEKRKEYVEKIEKIKYSVDSDVNSFSEKLALEMDEKIKAYKADLMAKNSLEIDKYTKRILMLDEIIKEDMPNAINLSEEIAKPDLEEVSIEVIETTEGFHQLSQEDITKIENNITERPGMASITIPER